jgi:hypothetical protein
MLVGVRRFFGGDRGMRQGIRGMKRKETNRKAI